MMVTLTVVVYVQTNVSWAIGLAIPTYLMGEVAVEAAGPPPPAGGVCIFSYAPVGSINSKLPRTDQFR
ncbi:unnamed protein product [Camellia sinensis]